MEFLLPFSSESFVLCFITRNVTIKVLRILILAVALYGYWTSSLPVREENELRMCEKRVLRNVFWTKWEEVTAGRIKLLMRILMIHTSCQIFLGWWNHSGWVCWSYGMHGREERCLQAFGRKTQRKHMVEGVCMGRRSILKGYLNNRMGGYGPDSSGSEWGPVLCCWELRNPLVSTNCREFHD